jgi:membrane protein DedA with SNARE-associated domain
MRSQSDSVICAGIAPTRRMPVLVHAVADDLIPIVFFAFLIEGAGLPFPSRLILLVAAASTPEPAGLATLVAATVVGALAGDHGPYLAGALAGPRVLRFYCRITLGSDRCVERAVEYFRRFGPAAILLSRFSGSVRLFAAALSGCGHIPYARFLAFDALGALAYATLVVIVGHLLGLPAADFFQRHGGARVLLLVGPVALATLVGLRLYRRRRERAARREHAIGRARGRADTANDGL